MKRLAVAVVALSVAVLSVGAEVEKYEEFVATSAKE